MVDNKNHLFCVGKVTSAHGIKGHVKIYAYTEDPLALGEYTPLLDKDGRYTYHIETLTSLKDKLVLAKIREVDNRNQAEALKNLELFVERRKLPDTQENEYYFHDLIGMHVALPDGLIKGEISAMYNFGAGDIMQITFLTSGKEEMVSFDSYTVRDLNLKKNIVVLNPEALAEDSLLFTESTTRS